MSKKNHYKNNSCDTCLDKFFPEHFVKIKDKRMKNLNKQTDNFSSLIHERIFDLHNNEGNHVVPKINNNVIHYSKKNDMEFTGHNRHHNSSVNELINTFDNDLFKKTHEYRNNDENTFEYNRVLETNIKKNKNIDMETDMIQGLPSRLFTQKKLSLGYKNPFEHNFDYVGSDIQNKEHVVMYLPRGGVNTRLLNKSYAND